MTKYCQKILVLGWLAGGALAGFAQNPLIVNSIHAIVQDSVITRGDVIYFTEPMRERLPAIYRDPQVFEQKYGQVLQDGLTTLIERKLILQDFKTAGGVLPEVAIDDEIKRRIRKKFGDRVELIQTLKASGRTYESYRQEVREQILEEILRARRLSAEIIISPYKIEAYYATNQGLYQIEDQVKLQMIRLLRTAANDSDSVRKRAGEILAKIESGTPFAEMTVNNEGLQSDWGWIGENKLSKGLSDIFFKLKAGQHTGVIGRAYEGDTVYWIYQYRKDGTVATARKYRINQDSKEVLVEERAGNDPATAPDRLLQPQEFFLLYVEDARGNHVRPLAEVRKEIEDALEAQEFARVQKKWIDKLRGKIFVTVY
jgi:DNA-directed RNA polymerase subunit H (RpoH/RPB5)